MAYTDFIAVIDLGTTRLIGMVGVKNKSTGLVTILAHEVEDADTAIRRGLVFNIEETAIKIKRLIQRMETKLNGAQIAKIYVGIGGQSIHSMDYSVVRKQYEEEVVTDDIIDILLEECRSYRPEGLDVLDIVPPTYYIDEKKEPNPVGVPYKNIEACFKLIVGRPSLRRHIDKSFTERAQIKVAGIVTSPLALSNVVLSEDEKSLGCALIDFGAGVTSVTVYKGGKLLDVCVIPLGGRLITKDLMSLYLTESEAERIKITYGNAISEKEDNNTIEVNSVDGIGMRQVKIQEVNYVIESRVKEILENVYALLEKEDIIKGLGAGIVITGGASNMRGLVELMQKKLKMEVRYATLKKGLIDNTLISSNSENFEAIGLITQGDENCALITTPSKPTIETTVLFPDMESPVTEDENAEKEKRRKEQKKREKEEQREEKKKKKAKWTDVFNKGMDKINTLFDEDDMR